jgi:hypothetical protein
MNQAPGCANQHTFVNKLKILIPRPPFFFGLQMDSQDPQWMSFFVLILLNALPPKKMRIIAVIDT